MILDNAGYAWKLAKNESFLCKVMRHYIIHDAIFRN